MRRSFRRPIQSPVASLANSALSRPRAAMVLRSSMVAVCLRLANLSRVTSRLLSRSTASRSTRRPIRSSNVSEATAGCCRCSSKALAMPTRPRAISRSYVGCRSICHSSVFFSPAAFLRAPPLRASRGTRSSGSCSVVVATPADVGVPDRGCVRRVWFGEGAIEPVLQNLLDRAVGGGADIVAAPGRGLDALRSIALHEAEDAKARAEALLGMRLCLHDRLEQRDRGGADLLGLAQHPCRRPFRITPMARRHVLRDRRVLVRDARAHVARNPLALVEDLDGSVREARLHGLAQQPERHRVVMVIDLDMIVGRNGAALPLGILVALARKPFQRRPVETGKEIVAALFQMLHHLRVDLRYAVANGVVQLDQGKEAFFNSCCTRPVDAATPVHAAAGSRDLGLSRSA